MSDTHMTNRQGGHSHALPTRREALGRLLTGVAVLGAALGLSRPASAQTAGTRPRNPSGGQRPQDGTRPRGGQGQHPPGTGGGQPGSGQGPRGGGRGGGRGGRG